MKVVDGLLLSKEAHGPDSFLVTLELESGPHVQYVVPKGAAWIDALGGSGSVLEFDWAFEKSKGRPARLVIDDAVPPAVWAFRTWGTNGYRDIEAIANKRKEEARVHYEFNGPTRHVLTP